MHGKALRQAIGIVGSMALAWAGCSKDSGQSTPSSEEACGPGSHRAPSGSCAPDAPPPPPASASAEPSAQASAEPAPSGSAAPSGEPRCLEVGNPERALVFDWQKEARVEPEAAQKLRGLTGAGSELKAFAAELDSGLRMACTRLAADLGNRGPFQTADAACQGAVDALKATRQKLGAGAQLVTQVHPSVCLESSTLEADCIKRCTGADAPELRCSGGAQGGRCAGACDGACEARPPGRCLGTCQGSCESGFTGTCQGTCTGTCDGKDMKQGGDCKGKCDGSCRGVAKGECKGACRGGCELKGSTCDGQCLGKCAQPVKDLLCSGDLTAAKLDATCEAHCQSRALRRASCSGAVVGARVDKAKDAAPARQLEAAIERHLPAVLQIEQHLKGRKAALDKARGQVKSGIDDLAKSPSPAVQPILPCLLGYQRAAADASSSLDATSRIASQVTKAALAK